MQLKIIAQKKLSKAHCTKSTTDRLVDDILIVKVYVVRL